jgi:molybdate transport system regulatory protein
MPEKTKHEDSLTLHLRLQLGGRKPVTLGPGRIELLGLVAETGSIREAARRMNMSYMKAWLLIKSMPTLVTVRRGGDQHGGAELTESGRKAVALYREMEQDSRQACEPSWKKLRRLLREKT